MLQYQHIFVILRTVMNVFLFYFFKKKAISLTVSCVVRFSIFGHEGEDAADVVYVNWLSMVRAGLLGLEFYTPESKSWRQVASLAIILSTNNAGV